MILNWHDFDAVFQQKPDYAPDQKTVENVIRHRKEFGDELFFDRIWKSIGLTHPSRKNYPARSNQDLRNLWSRIVHSPAPDEQKLALLFYVLLDCRGLHNADNTFVRRTYLPQKYQLLVQGLWELDHAQFSRALEHLTDPSLALPFADEVLLTLLKHPKCDSSLAAAFYISVSPPLKEQKTLDAYFELLSSNNLVEAYYFAKRQDELNHKSLFERLIAKVHQETAGHARAARATLLAGLPFSSEEEAWFENFLLDGKGSKLPGAKDTVMVRRIATGRSATAATESAALSRQKGENIDGVSWETVRKSITEATPS
ncbi:uncharacterized protein A1O9_00810 [Exophiala aquamarina CBS 119918]|uniref:ELYS-like domain-containing protein n=1 Tax=Exophiala aquamarina CBS 119918 TaxID=1182545 RepID=A0A072PSY2_9EURO|nr:uncharacterized protein A1O9_00810 [Exophiala aquamarina CBS 119918]KEF62837.1 hypothetical protein A1O9_00810 [Exophiala aquamarina CBS 119918]